MGKVEYSKANMAWSIKDIVRRLRLDFVCEDLLYFVYAINKFVHNDIFADIAGLCNEEGELIDNVYNYDRVIKYVVKSIEAGKLDQESLVQEIHKRYIIANRLKRLNISKIITLANTYGYDIEHALKLKKASLIKKKIREMVMNDINYDNLDEYFVKELENILNEF